MINELMKNVMNLGIITEDDVKRLTAIELLMLIIERTNGLLNHVENVDAKLVNLLETIRTTTIEVLNIWKEDGTFDVLINQTALEELNTRINTQLSRIQIDVLEHGVQINSTEPQQDKINEILERFKGHTIYFPDGDYLIDNSIIVRSNTTLKFSKNATVTFKSNFLIDSSTTNTHDGRHMLKNHPTDGLENIEIYGMKLYGNGYTQIRAGHVGMRFQNVKNLVVENCEFHEISGWSVAYLWLENFRFENIWIDACEESLHGMNGDGISGSGKNGIIRNVWGYSSDDLVSTHAGEDILDINCPVENILIENITCQPKGHDKCFRAFAIYDNGTSYTKNVTINGITGETKYKQRIRNLNRSTTNGKMSNIKLMNINLVNTSIDVEAVTIDNLELINVNLKDLDGVKFVNFMAIFNNSVINNLTLENIKCNLIQGNTFFINDHCGVKNIVLNNCYFNNDSGTSNYIYYRNDNESEAVTNLIPFGITGNVPFVGGKSAESKGIINLLPTSTSYYNGRLTYRDSDIVYDKSLGYKFYDKANDEWTLMSNINKRLKSLETKETPVIHITSGTEYEIKTRYSLVSTTLEELTINLVGEGIYNGIEFNVSISNDNAQITFKRDNVTLFSGTKLGKGSYKIIRLNDNFVYTKLSDEPFKS